MAITTSNFSKSLWPGLKSWYDGMYGGEGIDRLNHALDQDELVARVATMMLYLEHGHPTPEYRDDIEGAIDNMVSEAAPSGKYKAEYEALFDTDSARKAYEEDT